jgi:hypothetical protein
MIGMLLAYVLRASGLPGESLIQEAVLAAGRSIVWFATFALLYSIPWSGPSLVVLLIAGVAAALVNMSVSGGISFPAVAQPLWTVAALAVARAPLPREQQAVKPGLATFGPLLVLPTVCILFLILVIVPVAGSSYHLGRAQLARRQFQGIVADPKLGVRSHPADVVRRFIDRRFEDAIKADPGNISPLLEQAGWFLEMAEVAVNPLIAEHAIPVLERARKLDPLGKEVLASQFELRLRLAGGFKEKPNEQPRRSREKRHKDLAEAEKVLNQLRAIDPMEEARLHFRIAQVYLAAGDDAAGKRHAQAAHDLDREALSKAARLTGKQREQVEKWLKPAQ